MAQYGGIVGERNDNMAFEQTCPKCGAVFQLADELAGKSLRCQECKAVFVGTPRVEGEEPIAAEVEQSPPAKTRATSVKKAGKTKREAASASSGFGWLTLLGGAAVVLFGMTCGVGIVVLAASFLPTREAKDGNKDQVAAKDQKDQVAKPKDKEPTDEAKTNDNDKKKEDPRPRVSAPLPLDKFGRASVNVRLNDGEAAYRVELQKGTSYNFLAQSTDLEPMLSVSHGVSSIKGHSGNQTSFLSFAPEQTGEHVIIVTARGRNVGSVQLQFSPVETRPTVNIDASRTSQGYTTKDRLVMQNDVSPLLPKAPHRSFRMQVKAGTEFEFKANSKDFTPVMRVMHGNATLADWMDDKTGAIDARLKFDFNGEVLVLVSSNGGLGEYSLNIRPVPDRPPVQIAGRKVEFNGELYQHITAIPMDAKRDEKGTPYVIYDFAMEAGWAYSVDLKHLTGNVSLALFGRDGKQVTGATGFVSAHHARLLYDAKATENHPLLVSVANGGPQSYTLEITRVKLPVPMVVNARIATMVKKGEGFLSHEAEVVKGFIQTSSATWTRDGKAFLVMDETGWMHRFRLPEFVEEQKVFLDKDGIHNIHLTAQGVLVPRPKRKEFWLVDPNTMQVARRIPSFSTGGAILTGPEMGLAYTQVSGKVEEGPARKGLATHDLTGKTPVRAVFTDRLNGLIAISKDGNSIFARTDDGRLGRFRPLEKGLELEQAGDLYGPTPSANTLSVSADGKWLFRTIMPVKAPRDETTSVPPSGYGVLAYSVTDLSKPAFMIDTGSTAYHVVSDPRSNKIFTYSDARGMLVADPSGTVDEFPLPVVDKIKDRVRRIVMHPDGGKFVAVLGSTVSRVMYVEWDNAIPVAKAPIKLLPPKVGPFLRNFEPEPQRVGDLSVQKIANAVYWNTPGWSTDGKSFYLVQAQNVIYDVDSKDFNIRLSRFYTPFTWVRGGACNSAEGLLSVGCGEKMQGADMDLILLDPKTLQTIKRVRCPYSSHVVSAPNLSVAFVGGKNPFLQKQVRPELLIVDLKEGKALKPDVAFPLSEQTFQVSPDGKYFFGTDGKSIARFRISGTKLIHEETSKPIAQEEKEMPRLEISVDGSKVWLVGQAPAKEKDALGLYMLDSLDFSKPAREIKERVFSANIDPLTKALVIAKHDQAVEFVRADQPAPKGGDWICDTPRQIIMHPRGGELFLICNHTVYHVRWNNK